MKLFQELNKTLKTTKAINPSKRFNKRINEKEFTSSSNGQKITYDSKNEILFTARLTALYRSQESKSVNPLVIDTFADELAGDLNDFTMKHTFSAQRGDYGIVRTHYIDQLLEKWSETTTNSQIVLLGAGLDARAYRLKFLKDKVQTFYEIDMERIIHYKEKILDNYKPLCPVKRLSIDISEVQWFNKLVEADFSRNIPTLWILEGLAYYLEKKQVITILQDLFELSFPGSKIFLDVCVPALADLKFGFFTRYFKWGIQFINIPELFENTTWQISSSYADNHDHGRDVGQRGLIFIEGVKP